MTGGWLLTSDNIGRGERLRRSRRAGVLLAEAIHATLGVDQALFAREERVAGRTNVDAQLFLRRARLKSVPARASDRDDVQFGVNALLHDGLGLRSGGGEPNSLDAPVQAQRPTFEPLFLFIPEITSTCDNLT